MSHKQRKKHSRAFVVSNMTKKRVSGFLAGLLLVGGLLTPTRQAEAHTGYFLSILPDINNLSYLPLVSEDGPVAEKNHAEFQFMDGDKHFVDGARLPESLAEYQVDITKHTGLKLDGDKLKLDGETECFFTFPKCKTSGSWTENITGIGGLFKTSDDGTAVDREAATEVGEVLTSSINSALSYISRNLKTTNGEAFLYGTQTDEDKEKLFIQITSKFANAARGSMQKSGPVKDFTIKGTTFYVKSLDTETLKQFGVYVDPSKTSIEKYAFITTKPITPSTAITPKTEGHIFQYSLARYPLSSLEVSTQRGTSKTMTVYNIIALGNNAYVFGDVTTTSIDAVYNPNFIEEFLTNVLSQLLSGARSLLGLNSLGELMFNEGNYGLNTYHGLAPSSWFQAANVLFWVSQVFAWLLLAGATLKFLGMHMWSTVTPMQRVTLMNGIQNILITAFALTIIAPVFEVVANFNDLIIGVLRESSMFNDRIISGNMFPPTLAGVILGFIFFLSECVINFIYILRGATLALLYGTAPVFVVAFAFGGRYQGITLKFIKEVIGNIFMQTFHAIILTFYGLFIYTGASSGFLVNIAMAFAFIPITKVFKEITGIGESGFIQGVAQDVHGKTTGAAVNIAKEFGKGAIRGAGAAMVGGGFNRNSKDDGPPPPPGGGGGGGNDGPPPGGGGGPTSSGSTENLNSPDNQKSISDSMNGDNSNNVTMENGGGSVNDFAQQHDNFNNSGASLTRTTGNLIKGAGKYAGGVVLGTLGGGLGNKSMAKFGEKLAGSGLGNVRDGLGSVGQGIHNAGSILRHDPYENSALVKNPKGVDPDLSGNPSAEVSTYSGGAARELGVLGTKKEKIDGKDCLVQKISKDVAEKMPGFKDLQFDAKTGRATGDGLSQAGINRISKTKDGNYIFALDMQKRGIHDVRSMGNGARVEIKTNVGTARTDMNFVADAFADLPQKQTTSTESKTSNSSTSNSSSSEKSA